MNSIIEMVENKIKPKPQFINEKISKFFNLKKTELSIDRLTQEFGQMDSLVSNFMFEQILLLIKEYRLHGIKHQTKAITK